MAYERVSGEYLKAAHLNTVPVIAESIRKLHGPFSINTDESFIRTEEVRTPFLWTPDTSGDDWPYEWWLEPEHYIAPEYFTMTHIRHDHDRDIWFRVKVTGGGPPHYVTWFRVHETPHNANWCGDELNPPSNAGVIWMQSGTVMLISGDQGGIEQYKMRIPVNSWHISPDDHMHIDYIDVTYSGSGGFSDDDPYACENTHALWGWVRHGDYASVAHLQMDETPESMGGVIVFSGSVGPVNPYDSGNQWAGDVSTLKRFDVIYKGVNPEMTYTWEGVRAHYTSSGLKFVLNGLDASPSGITSMSGFNIDNFVVMGSNRYHGEIFHDV